MKFECLDVEALVGFDWDGYKLIEEIFFNEPLLVVEDFIHSLDECLCIAYGRDNKNRKIMVVFTTRENLIRVISAREMTKKEKIFYENNKNNPYI